jgi:hypothetical protein
LKNLKSKKKTLTIVVGNSNNYTGYSIFIGKSNAVASRFEFMGIESYKVFFPNGEDILIGTCTLTLDISLFIFMIAQLYPVELIILIILIRQRYTHWVLELI